MNIHDEMLRLQALRDAGCRCTPARLRGGPRTHAEDVTCPLHAHKVAAANARLAGLIPPAVQASSEPQGRPGVDACTGIPRKALSGDPGAASVAVSGRPAGGEVKRLVVVVPPAPHPPMRAVVDYGRENVGVWRDGWQAGYEAALRMLGAAEGRP